MKYELVAALTALANIDAARLNAWSTHTAGLNTTGVGLPFNPSDYSCYETELRVWVDEQLSRAAGAFKGRGPTLASRIRKAIDDAPTGFMSSDIYNQFPAAARSAIKDELKKRITDGSLVLVTMGRGRIANMYAHTQASSSPRSLKPTL